MNLIPTWHKFAGAAKWIACRTVPMEESRRRLEICKACLVAQVRTDFGLLFLSCGEPGEEGADGSCGCLCGISRKADTARVMSIEDQAERRRVALTVIRPRAKVRCRGSCPLGRW